MHHLASAAFLLVDYRWVFSYSRFKVMVAFNVMKMRRGQAMMDFGPFRDMLFADASGKFRQLLSPEIEEKVIYP